MVIQPANSMSAGWKIKIQIKIALTFAANAQMNVPKTPSFVKKKVWMNAPAFAPNVPLPAIKLLWKEIPIQMYFRNAQMPATLVQLNVRHMTIPIVQVVQKFAGCAKKNATAWQLKLFFTSGNG